MVLRAFDADGRVLEFHADRRSPKLRAMEARPVVELLAWAASLQLQVRMRGEAELHAGDAAARAAWEALSPGARGAYSLRAAPGQAVAAAPTAQPAAAPFAPVRVAIAALDILELGPKGAQFRVVADEDGVRRVGP